MPLRRLLPLLTIPFLLLAACGGGDGDDGDFTDRPVPTELQDIATAAAGGADVPEVDIAASDFAFDAPSSVEGGPVLLRLTNNGQEDHHAQLFRLNEGETLEGFQQALTAGPENLGQALAMGTLAGGPGTIAPVGTSETVQDLAPGAYVMLCFAETPEGVPHFVQGMITELEVTEPSGDAATLPLPREIAALEDFSFDVSDELRAGETTISAQNRGEQPHELAVLRLAEGIDDEAALALLTGEAPPEGATPGTAPAGPPLTSVGGIQALSPNGSGTAVLNLEPGDYVFVCLVPDPESGLPHVALGMFEPFEVE